MPLTFSSLVETWKAVVNALTFRRDNAPIDSADAVETFVATRAAFVAQKTLYGYLKTRIGTRYPRVFDDELFVRSINIAKFQVFAACLADLSIYASALVFKDEAAADDVRKNLAGRCFQRGLDDNLDEAPPEFRAEASFQAFAERLDRLDWANDALDRKNFESSADALLTWAPIADHFKEEDAEIVRNSIKFAWRDIREQFQTRLVSQAVIADRPDDLRLPAFCRTLDS